MRPAPEVKLLRRVQSTKTVPTTYVLPRLRQAEWLPNGHPVPLREDLHLISNKIQEGLKLGVRLAVEPAATFVGREHRWHRRGGRDDTSSPPIPASGRGRCRATGSRADRARTSLSVPAGADHRPVCPRRPPRHHCPRAGTMADGAAWPAFCHRE